MNYNEVTHKGKPIKEASYKELLEAIKWYEEVILKYEGKKGLGGLPLAGGLVSGGKDVIPVLKAELSNRIGK